MTQYSGKVIRKTPVTPTQQAASGVWKLNEQAAAIRNNNWPVPGVPNPISRSVRFRSTASAYLNRTPAIAGNRRTMTLSMWQKRGEFSSTSEPAIMWAGTNSSNYTLFRWGDGVGDANSKFKLNLNMYTGSTNINLVTTPLYRDPSAWYHIVLSIDTTQATAANRVRLYINGTEVTAFSSASYPSQNLDLLFNSVIAHEIGRFNFGSYLDGYMTEVNFIDGQQLTPSSFGTTDPLTGVWEPIAYTGTYGTNGFYLNFKDNTSTTTLGYDYSGNSNNWTANNISLTSGVTYDSMLDVPTQWIGYSTTTDTSAVTRGNYAVLNAVAGSTGTYNAISNGNLRLSNTTTSGTSGTNISPFVVSSGKWYWEVAATGVPAAPSNPGVYVGIADASNSLFGQPGGNGPASVGGYAYRSYNGNKVSAGGDVAYGATYTTNDVIGVALDLTAGTLTFYKNNVSQGTAYTGLTGTYGALGSVFQGGQLDFNFGQRPFTYTPPSGFKSLNTTNLPDSTIVQGNQWMDATTYTGNGGTQTVSGVQFAPDLVWIKNRGSVTDHGLFDTIRGATKRISSNLTNAESTEVNSLTAFTSSGFTVGATQDFNQNGVGLVAWQWKANGTPAVTNTAGSITSTVSASTTSGFSVVTYTGTSAAATVGHGLGVAPKMIIVKSRSLGTGNWCVYHTSTSALGATFLNLTNGYQVNANIWNNTAPTSSVFSLAGSDANNGTCVAYCFAEIEGFSKFGSYTGNGSSAGPFVYLGFRPEFIMIKRTDTTGSWLIVDAARSPNNTSVNGGMRNVLVPNTSGAEDTGADICDGLSNGFRFYQGAAAFNANGGTYIYMAFAQNPFKNALAR